MGQMYQRPVFACTTSGATVKLVPYEHTAVLIAANSQVVTYNDPYDASVRFSSWGDFQRVSSYFDKIALVVQ